MTSVIGIDTGYRWTAGVLLVDDVPVSGFTFGPIDEHGRLDPTATDEIDDVAIYRYATHIIFDGLNPLREKADAEPLMAVEHITVPKFKRKGVPVRNWLVPHDVMLYVCATFPGTVLVPARGNGTRHYASRGGNGDLRTAYPRELGRRRPAGWGPNDAPRGARDHERAAYDVAAFASTRRLEAAGAAA